MTQKIKRPVFVSVHGWVGIWEKGTQIIDVYRTTDAARPGMANEMIAALREGRDHPMQVSLINVSDKLNGRGSPKGFLSDNQFVKVALMDWDREYGDLHRENVEAVAA